MNHQQLVKFRVIVLFECQLINSNKQLCKDIKRTTFVVPNDDFNSIEE